MRHRISAQRVPLGMLLVLAMALAMSSVSVIADIKAACAHDDTRAGCGGETDLVMSYDEEFKGEGVAAVPQKQDITRSVQPLGEHKYGIDLVSKLRVQDRNGGLMGRIADVTAHGDYAYLTAFRDPSCERGGVHVVDISNPEQPKELVGSFIPTSRGSYAGEGIKVRSIDNEHFTGDLLVFQNETCGTSKAKESSGGISLWDVTRPNNPKLLSAHQGDFTNDAGGLDPAPNQVHSFDVWTHEGRTYAALVDNEEWTDVDILDITDPRRPVLINDTLDMFDETAQETPAGLTSVFSHDMDVKQVDGRWIMSLNYWDGGYVLMDVTDPTIEGGVVLAQSDYPALDEERLARDHEISPEGNAHQSELSLDNDYLIGTDEDFDAYRTTSVISSGPNEGMSFNSVNASGTAPVSVEEGLTGDLTHVGEACEPLSAATTEIALIERGTCAFQVKFDNMKAAGYQAGIVFNSQQPECLSYVTMLADGDLPFLFVNRADGLRLLGVEIDPGSEGLACETGAPADAEAASISITSIFDGWGFVRLFRADVGDGQGTPGSGSLESLDTYAIPEAQDEAYASGYGDLSVHEVAMDKRRNDIGYLSYYAGGIRVVQIVEDDGGAHLEEIGAFVEAGGSNFWGVEMHEIRGKQYVLGSDRDYGLYIFEAVDP